MFAMEWIFTLFSSIIPIEQVDLVFDEFFKSSWIFLYKLIIHLLRSHERVILEKDNISEMMSPIKDFKPKGFFDKLVSFFPLFNNLTSNSSWIKFVKEAKEEIIYEKYIKQLLNSYDLENKRFKLIKRK